MIKHFTRHVLLNAFPANRERPGVAIVSRTLECGGAGTMALSLGRYLASHGFRVDMITTSHPGAWFDSANTHPLAACHIEGRFARHPLIHAYRVGRTLIKGRYDVIILNNSERYAHAAIHMLPNHTVVIPWIHSDEQDAYAKGLFNEPAWNVAIACGPKVGTQAARLVRQQPVVTIINGTTIPNEDLWQARRRHSRPLRLIYLGRISQRGKNVLALPQILQACHRLGVAATLMIVGDGPERGALAERINALGLDPYVTFAGAIPREDIYTYLLDAHALIMPSHYEGLPCAPLEAQACGCVPILTHLPGITDVVIEDGRTGLLVEPGDIGAFARSVAELDANPTLWAAMSQTGRMTSIRKFSLEAMGKKFEELLDGALKGSYPLPKSRRNFLPVNPCAFTWRELVPKRLKSIKHHILVATGLRPRQTTVIKKV